MCIESNKNNFLKFYIIAIASLKILRLLPLRYNVLISFLITIPITLFNIIKLPEHGSYP